MTRLWILITSGRNWSMASEIQRLVDELSIALPSDDGQRFDEILNIRDRRWLTVENSDSLARCCFTIRRTLWPALRIPLANRSAAIAAPVPLSTSSNSIT